ncbi:MAG: TIGR03915 family putative DNA repair protein [Lachnospiraceae bacterium]|nr:TIGR03915 family putative DNA repair protein [Candidatus Colinaster equi]
MYIYSCAPDWESMLTCIYEAWSSNRGHNNIRLELEPINQYELFSEYIHIDADSSKAEKVMDSINLKISPAFYNELVYVSFGYEPDRLDIIYRMLLLGFTYGPCALEMTQYAPVARFFEISRRIKNEAHSFIEFLRFHEIRKSVYVAHFEPKSRIAVTLGMHFSDRMPSEYWMIIDDVHHEAIVHPRDEDYYLRILNDDEYQMLLETEHENDEYTDLWQTFFDTIAIKERENYRCQRTLLPKWKRKHMVEFK